ncbi:MAG TPA: protein kinase [Actinoplanes sp.]|nr:protein kinase [Actinoplanes sp.]
MLSPGVVLNGRYQLTQRIAAGGMGEVWRGNDVMLKRDIGVKVILPALMSDRDFITRFRSEARMMAALRNPGIVQVYDYGENAEVDGRQLDFMVMEFVEGTPLTKRIQQAGRISPVDTMQIIAQVADALHTAHEAGIVHRDVKPSNLLVRPNGSIVLIDFGVARETAVEGITGTNVVLGSAHYMAPEQAEGQKVTPLTDVYALGAVAYACLTGRPPYVGDNPLAVLAQLVHGKPPVLPPDVPAGVAAVVLRALDREPQRRFPTAAALAAAARAAASQPHANPAPGYGGQTRPYSAAAGGFPPPGQGTGSFPGRGGPSGPFPGQQGPGTGSYPGQQGPGTGSYPGQQGPGTGSYPGRAAASGPYPAQGQASGRFPNQRPGAPGGFAAGAASVGAPSNGGGGFGDPPSGGYSTGGYNSGGYDSGNFTTGGAPAQRSKSTIALASIAVVAVIVGIGVVANSLFSDDADPSLQANDSGIPAATDEVSPTAKPSKSPKATKTTKPAQEEEPEEEEEETSQPEEPETNPYTPQQLCGDGFDALNSRDLIDKSGVNRGTVYLLGNSDRTRCVVTIRSDNLSQRTSVGASLEVQDGEKNADKGNERYYVGPVVVENVEACVRWGGSIGNVTFTSEFEQCPS